jgi:hypothetical protein
MGELLGTAVQREQQHPSAMERAHAEQGSHHAAKVFAGLRADVVKS